MVVFKHVDVAHDAAQVGYQDRLAKALARDAIHRAIAEAAAVNDERSSPPRHSQAAPSPVLHHGLSPARRLASLLR